MIAIVAVVILASSGNDDEEATTPAAATAAQRPRRPEAETAAPETPTPDADADARSRRRRSHREGDQAALHQGEPVRFRVRSDVADHVHVHGYDLMKDVEPGKTVTFSFPADDHRHLRDRARGTGEQIAQLRVDPD